MPLQHYRELLAWQRAMDLAAAVYAVTKSFPADERFGLTNQLRRAAVSVPSNIAEGQGRGISADFTRFMNIANGSRQEVDTQLMLAQRFGYIDASTVNKILDISAETGRLLSGLKRSVKT